MQARRAYPSLMAGACREPVRQSLWPPPNVSVPTNSGWPNWHWQAEISRRDHLPTHSNYHVHSCELGGFTYFLHCALGPGTARISNMLATWRQREAVKSSPRNPVRSRTATGRSPCPPVRRWRRGSTGRRCGLRRGGTRGCRRFMPHGRVHLQGQPVPAQTARRLGHQVRPAGPRRPPGGPPRRRPRRPAGPQPRRPGPATQTHGRTATGHRQAGLDRRPGTPVPGQHPDRRPRPALGRRAVDGHATRRAGRASPGRT